MSKEHVDTKIFTSGIIVVQSFVIAMLGGLNFGYSFHIDATGYGYFRDVSIMIFFGFGFLMTFLHKHGLAAVGYCFIISALVVELSLVAGYLLNNGAAVREENGGHYPVSLENLLEGLFCAGAVMISFGAVLGKVSPSQLLVLAVVETFAFWANFRLAAVEVGAHDVGGGMVIHSFGAYFGLAATWFVSKGAAGHKDEKSIYSSDLFSLAGTIFLFVLWPSFQAAVAGEDERQFMAVSNTFVSLCSSTLAFATISKLLEGKFSVVHMQNATLAGGVAMGVCGDMEIGLHGAMAAGFLSGALSCVGFTWVQPKLEHLGIHDTCGVNNLHGLPGIFGALLAVLVVAVSGNGCESCELADKGFPGVTAQMQLYALLVTLGVSLASGTFAGLLMMALASIGAGLDESQLYNDEAHFHRSEAHCSDDLAKAIRSAESGPAPPPEPVKESNGAC
jgi:ammonium transporter Rh